MHTRIFLIGFMGSGKSTLGKQLAVKLGYRFMDMDRMIEKTSGMAIQAIFSEYGEEMFRKWEHDILLELLGMEQIVVATGGGAPCHRGHMEMMNRNGLTIYIQLTAGAINRRLDSSKTERPLIKGKSGSELLEYISDTLNEREPIYKKANLTVDGVGLKSESLVSLIRDFCK